MMLHDDRPRPHATRHDAMTAATFAAVSIVILLGVGRSAWTVGAVVTVAVLSVADIVRHHVGGRIRGGGTRWHLTAMPLIRVTHEERSTPADD